MPAGQMGIFFYGPNQDMVPFGDGYRCVGPGSLGLFRLYPPSSTGSGTMTYTADLTAPPQPTGLIVNGSTWNFQAWYRDPAALGSGFNLSDGYEIAFAPASAYDGMALIPAGSFEMGRHVGSGGSDELPVHTVNLDAFYMDIHEVTILEYADYLNNALARGEVTVSSNVVYQVGGAGEALCDTSASSSYSHLLWDGTSFSADPSHPVTGSWAEHPMNQVSWHGACAYANGKSRDVGLDPCYDESDWSCDFTQNGYRLPTEAEWEYAARGGEHSPYYMYPWGISIDGSKANYWASWDPFDGLWSSQSTPETTPVGYYDGNQTPTGLDMANGYGLYDMSGNVWGWCGDWYDSTYYSNSPSNNPTGPATGSYRMFRGGGWYWDASSLRSAFRGYSDPTYRSTFVGVRVLAVSP
jgi:formylglycine-generating enzyme required for sulfatase activity